MHCSVFPQLVDYRVEFSKWWVNEFKTVKLPSQGTVFDYYLDPDSKKFLPWTEKVPAFELDPDAPLQVTDPNGRRVAGDGGAGPSVPAALGDRTSRCRRFPATGPFK